MMNRLLHTPMVTLKEPHGSVEEMLTRVEIVRQLFGLDAEAHELTATVKHTGEQLDDHT